MMYVPDGWGTVYAIDVSSGKKGTFKWKFDPADRQGLGRRRRLLRRQQPRRGAVEGQGHLDLARRAHVRASTRRPARRSGSARSPIRRSARRSRSRRWSCATSRSSARPAANSASAATSTAPTSIPASRLWRTYTIPGAGEPGNETWKDGKERWKHGGGSIWETATYDPETDTIYQGIGNAGPDWDPEYRPGDNKWAASVLALDPTDGKIKWGYPVHAERPVRLRRNLRAPDHQRQGQRRGPQARGACGAQRLLLRARPHQRLVRRRQAICRRAELDARPRSEDRPAAQLRSDQGRAGLHAPGSHGSRASRRRRPALPVALRRQELGADRLQSGAQPALHSHRSKAATTSSPSEQKDFVDQGGTVKPRERFAGGGTEDDRAPATAASRRSIRRPARPRRG